MDGAYKVDTKTNRIQGLTLRNPESFQEEKILTRLYELLEQGGRMTLEFEDGREFKAAFGVPIEGS